MQCQLCVITGRVQGVFYRHGTCQEAQRLGITGWVRNLPSGEVECLICGEEKALQEMLTWLRKGPPAASVTDVHVTMHPVEHFVEFQILR